MDAITRYSATDPVKFDGINKNFDEIEARDEELEQQINNLIGKACIRNVSDDFNLVLTQGEYMFASTKPILHCPRFWSDGYSQSPGYGKLVVRVSDGGTHNNSTNWIWQTLYFTNDRWGVWERNKINGEVWTEWRLISPISISSPPYLNLQNGWSQFVGHQIVGITRVGKMAFLYGFVNVGLTAFNTIIISGIPPMMIPEKANAIRTVDMDIRVTQSGEITIMTITRQQGDTINLNGICWECLF